MFHRWLTERHYFPVVSDTLTRIGGTTNQPSYLIWFFFFRGRKNTVGGRRREEKESFYSRLLLLLFFRNRTMSEFVTLRYDRNERQCRSALVMASATKLVSSLLYSLALSLLVASYFRRRVETELVVVGERLTKQLFLLQSPNLMTTCLLLSYR